MKSVESSLAKSHETSKLSDRTDNNIFAVQGGPQLLDLGNGDSVICSQSEHVGSSVDTENRLEKTTSSPTSTLKSLDLRSDEFCHFAQRVQELCHVLWPAKQLEAQCADRFMIEDMRGGGYNRVVGIDRIGEDGDGGARMILRVPRMGVPQSDQDVLNTQFARKHTRLPVPEILAVDTTSNNPLDQPYIIQSRIPGHDLDSESQSYPGLSHSQKLMFVYDFCQILLSMQKVQHRCAGQIVKISDQGKLEFGIGPFEVFPESTGLETSRSERLPFFKVHPFQFEDQDSTYDNSLDAAAPSPLYFFEVQFARWRNLELGLDPSELWHTSIWHRLLTAAQQMDEFGCLDCEYYCLAHYDLEPRNIMVQIQSGVPKITGIIDWDMAIFAPDWVSCKPPTWVWNWKNGGNEDEEVANEEPLTVEQQQLKDLFDELVGFDFRYNTYQPHYRLARQLFCFARYGLRSSDLRDEAEKMLGEWEVLYQKKQAAWEQRGSHEDSEVP